MSDLEASKELKTLRGIDFLNYERMKYDYYPHFTIYFQYEENGAWGNLEGGYIDAIILTSNGKAILEEYKGNYIFNGSLFNFYSINVSDESFKMLLDYIDNINE